MDSNTFILRFDNPKDKMSPKKGISIHVLSELLGALNEAIGVDDKDSIYLTEIKDQSVGYAIYSPNELAIENLRLTHNKIAEGKYSTIENREWKYLRLLKKITDTGAYLEASDNANYFVRINSVSGPDKLRSITEYEEVVGRISEIGGDRLFGKRHIKLDEFENDIQITPEQDDKLKYFYKQDQVILYLKITRNFNEKEKVKTVELVDFEAKSQKSLKQSIQDFILQKGDVFKEINDSVSSIRDLR
jgi:hypothetical protein